LPKLERLVDELLLCFSHPYAAKIRTFGLVNEEPYPLKLAIKLRDPRLSDGMILVNLLPNKR
jgi:hypothetical protein